VWAVWRRQRSAEVAFGVAVGVVVVLARARLSVCVRMSIRRETVMVMMVIMRMVRLDRRHAHPITRPPVRRPISETDNLAHALAFERK
jgi:hypothetical protein